MRPFVVAAVCTCAIALPASAQEPSRSSPPMQEAPYAHVPDLGALMEITHGDEGF